MAHQLGAAHAVLAREKQSQTANPFVIEGGTDGLEKVVGLALQLTCLDGAEYPMYVDINGNERPPVRRIHSLAYVCLERSSTV
jgi:hypothetical protein